MARSRARTYSGRGEGVALVQELLQSDHLTSRRGGTYPSVARGVARGVPCAAGGPLRWGVVGEAGAAWQCMLGCIMAEPCDVITRQTGRMTLQTLQGVWTHTPLCSDILF